MQPKKLWQQHMEKCAIRRMGRLYRRELVFKMWQPQPQETKLHERLTPETNKKLHKVYIDSIMRKFVLYNSNTTGNKSGE